MGSTSENTTNRPATVAPCPDAPGSKQPQPPEGLARLVEAARAEADAEAQPRVLDLVAGARQLPEADLVGAERERLDGLGGEIIFTP